MIDQFDEREVERIAKEKSLVGLIEREGHNPPFPREVWYKFGLISGGRSQATGEYIPAYEMVYAEAIEHFQDFGVLTTVDDGAYVVLKSRTMLNPSTPDGKTLYFVNKEDAEQYASTWHYNNLRVRKLSSD